jgi:mannosyl-oligosaccharide alpha-1,2-mannosidase
MLQTAPQSRALLAAAAVVAVVVLYLSFSTVTHLGGIGGAAARTRRFFLQQHPSAQAHNPGHHDAHVPGREAERVGFAETLRLIDTIALAAAGFIGPNSTAAVDPRCAMYMATKRSALAGANDGKDKPVCPAGRRCLASVNFQGRSAANPRHPALDERRAFDDVADDGCRTALRRDLIRREFQHAWGAYKHSALGADGFRPLSGDPMVWAGGGFAATAVAALSTMHIMGLHDEFKWAVSYLTGVPVSRLEAPLAQLPPPDARGLWLDKDGFVSIFDAATLLLGGILSAYELSGERIPALLLLAAEIGDTIGRGLPRSGSGFVPSHVNPATGETENVRWRNNQAMFAEIGGVQVEFRALGYHLRNGTLDRDATLMWLKAMRHCANPAFNVCGVWFDARTFLNSGALSFGAMSDAAYEGTLKQFQYTGGSEREYGATVQRMLNGMKTHMWHRDGRGWQFVDTPHQSGKMDLHACYLGSLLAQAARELDGVAPDGDRNAWAQMAADVTATCYAMYALQPSGLAADTAHSRDGVYMASLPHAMRGETFESLLQLWRATGQPMYREWAWNILDSTFRYCRVPSGGFAGIVSVALEDEAWEPVADAFGMRDPQRDDSQPVHLLSETLKYAYLLFDDPTLPGAFDPAQWVFTSGGQPLKVRKGWEPRTVWPGHSPTAMDPAEAEMRSPKP